MVNVKCTHCGKRISFGEFCFPNVHVSVKSADIEYSYDAYVLCGDCFEKLNDRIGRMIREVQDDSISAFADGEWWKEVQDD